MKPLASAISALAVLSVAAAGCSSKSPGGAQDKLYSLEASARTPEVVAGEKGEVELQLKLARGVHVSDEAPFKILLSGRGLAPDKERLGHADAAPMQGASSGEGATRFEIPFTAQSKGPASLGADLDFYVCTATLCERQQEKVQVKVTVK
jgi:hypothetical protein